MAQLLCVLHLILVSDNTYKCEVSVVDGLSDHKMIFLSIKHRKKLRLLRPVSFLTRNLKMLMIQALLIIKTHILMSLSYCVG